MRHHAFALIAALLLAYAPAPLTSPALAQSDETVADLRRENDQLRERLAQLEATLATLLEQNQALINETRALRDEVLTLRDEVKETSESVDRRLDDQPAPTPPEPLNLAPPTDNPMDSPGQLLEAIRRDHDGRYPELMLDNQDAQKRYLFDLKRWFKALERDFTTRVTWLIDVVAVEEIHDESLNDDSLRIIFYVIDPDSELPYDAAPSTIIVEGRSALRVLDQPDLTRWTVNGIFGARPKLNTQREERGLIDTPPFVGPYVEFAYGFRVTSIVPVIPQR